MHKTTKAVWKVLRKDRMSTVKAVASAAGIEIQVARRHLDALVALGTVAQESVKETGKRGRPAKLYRRAA